MAIYYARKSGNVNATDVWATTPTGTAGNFFSSFTNQDTLMANSFTITLNVNTTVAEIRNDTSGGATAGGIFNLNDGVTLIANIVGGLVLSYSGSTSATIIGSIRQLSSYAGISVGGSGTLNIIGNIFGAGSSSWAVYFSAGILNITGNLIGAGALGSNLGTPVSANITGNVLGTQNLTGSTINFTNNLPSLNIIGSAIAGPVSSVVSYNPITTTTITRVVGNGFGPGSVGVTSQVAVTAPQNSPVRVYEIEYGPLGQSPTAGPVEMLSANSNVAVFATRFGSPKTLVDLNNAVNLVPSSGNVRSGVSYNYGNNTGSCVIPNPNSVVYGVPVDNTVGSGLLSPVAVWNALTSSIGTSGSISERLKNCSTVSTVGKQLEGVL